MTRDVLIENCRRVLSFFKDNDKYADYTLAKEVSDIGLLKTYACILDWNGAPRSYMSRLYLPDKHYEEFVEFAKGLDNYKEVVWPERIAISFDFDGYNWIVEKK